MLKPRRMMMDAQQAMGFLVSQTSYIEREAVAIRYPDIQYPQIIPVDTSANEWAKSVTYYSTDRVGRAGWFHHLAKDLHFADVERAQHEVGLEMADIGYRYSVEELGVAQMTGQPLTSDRAAAARRAYEEFVDGVAIQGDTAKNFAGLMNYPGIDIVIAGNDWANRTADEILADVNSAITGMYVATNTVELADTLLLPIAAMSIIATKRIPETSITVLDFLARNNVYTHTTGQQLTIRAVRGLDTAGTGGTGRMIAYRRDPQILKLHIPMPHRFMPVFHSAPLVYDVPGIFRLGGLEVRRPKAIRYIDGIIDAPYV